LTGRLARGPQQRGYLAVKAHPQVGVKVRVHKHGLKHVDQPPILSGRLMSFIALAHDHAPA
jgi:hypothetical protein